MRKRISGCRVQGRRGPGGGAGAEPPLCPYLSPYPCFEASRGGFAITTASFAAGEGGEGVESGAWVWVGVEAEVAFGSDAPPVAGEEGAAEEVGPDGEVVEAPFVALGPDADEASVVGEEWELVGFGHGEGLSGVLGFIHRELYQMGDSVASGKRLAVGSMAGVGRSGLARWRR